MSDLGCPGGNARVEWAVGGPVFRWRPGWSQVLEPGAGAAARAPPGGGDGVHDDGT